MYWNSIQSAWWSVQRKVIRIKGCEIWIFFVFTPWEVVHGRYYTFHLVIIIFHFFKFFLYTPNIHLYYEFMRVLQRFEYFEYFLYLLSFLNFIFSIFFIFFYFFKCILQFTNNDIFILNHYNYYLYCAFYHCCYYKYAIIFVLTLR